MSTGWVAGSVRARALAPRRLGAGEARRLAACGSLSDALRMLAATAYGTNLRPEQPVALAQHEIAGSVLWDLRVLAGWPPRPGGTVAADAAGTGPDIARTPATATTAAASGPARPQDLPSHRTARPALAAGPASECAPCTPDDACI
jgi:hypothetical protein